MQRWMRPPSLLFSCAALLCACAEPGPTPAAAQPEAKPVAAPVDPVPAAETEADTGGEADEELAQAEPPPPEPLKAPDGTVILPCEEPPPGMACIPGGPFIRGKNDADENARPEAEVWLQTYYMDIHEVTNELYDACERERKCDKAGPAYSDFSRPKQPVNGINWFHADKYCRAQGKHLPTEAQWEKAARGTDGRTYPWGEEIATCELAIIKVAEGRSCGIQKKGNKPETGRVLEVGQRAPNQYGLYDMAGNSFEWVADWYASDYEQCGEACLGTDPKGPCGNAETCRGHARKGVRGGSWYWGPERATTYHRRAHTPRNQPFHHFGFRCAASLEEARAAAAPSE